MSSIRKSQKSVNHCKGTCFWAYSELCSKYMILELKLGRFWGVQGVFCNQYPHWKTLHSHWHDVSAISYGRNYQNQKANCKISHWGIDIFLVYLGSMFMPACNNFSIELLCLTMLLLFDLQHDVRSYPFDVCRMGYWSASMPLFLSRCWALIYRLVPKFHLCRWGI